MALDTTAVDDYADALAVVRGGVTGSLKEVEFAEATRDFIKNADVNPTNMLDSLGGAVSGTGDLT
jgi:hypothetical protein